MLAKLNTFALVGIDAAAVEAEVDVAAGLPKTVMLWAISPISAVTMWQAGGQGWPDGNLWRAPAGGGRVPGGTS
jgi:hypothetical protein